MVLLGIGDDEMPRAFPERSRPYLAFGDYLRTTGRDDAARDAYRRALDYLKNENPITGEPFYKVFSYFMSKGLFDEALGVMQQARATLPDDAGIHLRSGTAYESLGMKKRAAEEYEKAWILDPEEEEARRRLTALREGQGR
jgi:tetratricopeptide (TPR) repeat protein